MNIYLEEVFIENFIVNISVIILLYILSKKKINISKLFICSIFMSLICIIKIYNICNNLIIQILSVNFIVYIIFKDKKIITYLKNLLYFYFIYIEYIGIIIFSTLLFDINLKHLYIRCIFYIIATMLSYIIDSFMWKLWKTKLANDSLKYKIIFKDQDMEFNVILDTGNFITDPCGINEVIILSEIAYLKKIQNKKLCLNSKNINNIEIDIKTVIGKSVLKGSIYNNVLIKKNNKEIYVFKKIIILFVEGNICNKRFDGIIGYDTYLNKLGGVKL